MQSDDALKPPSTPLAGIRVLEHCESVAGAYAGRLLATLGAEVIMLESPTGCPLRFSPPWFDESGESALFAYLAVGKQSVVADLRTEQGREILAAQLSNCDIFLDDTPVRERPVLGLSPENLKKRFPQLVHVSILPFGAVGPKADWVAEEMNLLHAAGEGYLLPNGLSNELFPDRAPLKIHGHFAGYQGGATAALAAMTALWSVPTSGGQYVDVSVQDAMLLVGAFAVQRLGDGSVEHRATRKFRYGGVFKTADGYIELLTLEDRQWNSLVELLGNPAWAFEPALQDPLERSRRGDEINTHIRAWMVLHKAEDIVREAQKLGVPIGKYRTPLEVSQGEHERDRGLFVDAFRENGSPFEVLLAPFKFLCSPLIGGGKVPALGEMTRELNV
ncbi:CoA transferase [Zwartia sp.]|uniref:CoA transferase n=1 Tax=Zwartia sp. TaxID=2978004 RepID=UPI00271E6EB2|nr:CoA transferase [Zwartia sp.]MDO9024334.1 CoA transferase [Zwartia sp.]